MLVDMRSDVCVELKAGILAFEEAKFRVGVQHFKFIRKCL